MKQQYQDLYNFIEKYQKEHGSDPTWDTMCEGLSISRPTLMNRLDVLEGLGKIERVKAVYKIMLK